MSNKQTVKYYWDRCITWRHARNCVACHGQSGVFTWHSCQYTVTNNLRCNCGLHDIFYDLNGQKHKTQLISFRPALSAADAMNTIHRVSCSKRCRCDAQQLIWNDVNCDCGRWELFSVVSKIVYRVKLGNSA